MRKKDRPTPISEFISELFKKKGWTNHLLEQRLSQKWPTIVGDQLAQKSSPLHLKYQVLTIGVTHSAWYTELHYLKFPLIEKIKKTLNIHLKDIRFKMIPTLPQETTEIIPT